jgi:ABC-type Fe3+ transport system substrate-binding protein
MDRHLLSCFKVYELLKFEITGGNTMKNQSRRPARKLKVKTELYGGLIVIFLFGFLVEFSRASDPTVLEASKKEGQLMWYNTLVQPHAQEIINRFMKKYPFVRASFWRGSGIKVHARLTTEARAGRYEWDVVSLTDAESVSDLREKGLVARYNSVERNMFSDDLKDKEGYWTAYYALPTGLILNTNQVKMAESPKSYEDLLRPTWKGGRISIDTEGYELLVGLTQAWGKDKAVTYLKRLAAQEPVPGRGNNARIELLAAGEFPLAIAYTHTAEAIKKKGGPIEWTNLEPVVVKVDSIMLGSRAPHSNVGKLFIDFILSEEGQRLLQGLQRPTLRTGVEPNPQRLSKGYARVVLQPEHSVKVQENVRLYKQIFQLQ